MERSGNRVYYIIHVYTLAKTWKHGNTPVYSILAPNIRVIKRGKTLYVYKRENEKHRPLIKIVLKN